MSPPRPLARLAKGEREGLDRAMRPEILYPLFAPVQTINGIGPKLAGLLEKLCGPKLIDTLLHMPEGHVDRRSTGPLQDLPPGQVASVRVTIGPHTPPPPAARRRPYRIEASDETGTLWLTFFHARADYLQQLLPEGEERLVSGRLE
ncbi:MAG: hypothetical protein AAGB03_10095, partial [Pseudomonadota bacterium]